MGTYNTKIKLSFKNERTKFFVNEKKRTVTCTMEGFLKVRDEGMFVLKYPYYPVDNTFVKGVGVAKCDPRDVFDVELGKSIARARAEADAYLKAKRRLSDQYDIAVAYLKALTDFEEKAYRCAAHNDEFVDRLLDEQEKKGTKKPNPQTTADIQEKQCEPESPIVDTTDDGITVKIKFKRK